MSTATAIGNTLLILAAIPAILSALVYGFGVTWWRSQWGRHLFSYMTAVAVVFSLGLLKLAGVDSTLFAYLRAAAYAFLVMALWWRLLIILQAKREGSPDEGKPHVR